MKAKHLAILMISSFCVIIVTIYYLLISIAFGNLCENYIVSETSSDNYTATIFTRGCGATTSDNPYINIRKKNEDIYFESSSNKQVFLSVASEHHSIDWKDDSILVVECEDCLTDGINNANSKTQEVFEKVQIASELKR